MVFADRRHAGRLLADQLQRFAGARPVVVALPRGGVPVGFEIARALGAPLEILLVRKLGAPGNPEFGVGAIVEDGTLVLDRSTASRVGLTSGLLEETVAREARELRRRVVSYRGGRPALAVRERTVIVADDGLATGVTDVAAVRALRRMHAARVIVAVPVGVRASLARVGKEADEVICHTVPRELHGVGFWYEDFSPVSDEQVVDLLNRAHAAYLAE
ncbi:MAG TPA: phosphoribosyltransferase family protein [Solirubrobacteraceae bacterium]|nr:phosphoribosyltransferase family protein [Solirubrobacteraceae bacterium]